MLGKLLKYELKSTMRIFLPMYGGALLLALIAHFSYSSLPNNKLFDLITGFLTMIFVIALISMIAITLIMIVQRFYKNVLGNEGYLTLTLPVKTYQLVLSKLLVGAMWLASTIIILLCSILLVLPDYSLIPIFFNELRDGMQAFASILPANLNVATFVVTGIALLIVAIFMGVAYIHFAMTVGHLAPKHKVLCSFGAYIVIDLFVQTALFSVISSLLSADIKRLTELSMTVFTNEDLPMVFTQAAPFALKVTVITLLVYALLATVYTVLSAFILKKKPNLE